MVEINDALVPVLLRDLVVGVRFYMGPSCADMPSFEKLPAGNGFGNATPWKRHEPFWLPNDQEVWHRRVGRITTTVVETMCDNPRTVFLSYPAFQVGHETKEGV